MRCENPKCREELSADHVILVTTMHFRRFCSVECLEESHRIHMDALAAEFGLKRQ